MRLSGSSGDRTYLLGSEFRIAMILLKSSSDPLSANMIRSSPLLISWIKSEKTLSFPGNAFSFI